MATKENTRTGPSDPQAEQSQADARERPKRTYGGVDANKSKRELVDDAREAGIAGTASMTKDELAKACRSTTIARRRGPAATSRDAPAAIGSSAAPHSRG
jgi:hypothetical protein